MSMRWCVLLALLGLALPLAGCEGPDKRDAPEGGEMAERLPVPAPSPRDGLIPVGDPAPDFEATGHDGNRVVLSELLATKDVVLIFYPADFTPGCTKQLCAVRDEWSEFTRRGTVVLGVNPAGVARHAEFAQEHRFPFPVICDAGAHIAAGYGAGGKNPDNPQRTVYVIRRNRRVALSERGMVPHDRIFAALERP